MFLKIFLLCFFLYVLYRFVFEFLLPVYKATQKIKKGFRDIHEKANENMNKQQQNDSTAGQNTNSSKKKTLGEYIDFEEVK